MVIQLNPLLPVVWRTPDTVQVGIDNPVVIVTGVTAGLEAVLWALQSGLPRSGAILIGTEAGASVAAVERLIDELAPALRTSVPRHGDEIGPVVVDTVLVDGAGPTSERLRGLLHDLGVPVGTAPDTASGDDPALAVLIGHYVLEPARHTRWLRRDVPQLPVVFSDTEVRIGPLVEPGSGPCLLCVDLHHRDRDPAWPALATQLLRRRAETETSTLAAEVAARTGLLVLERLISGASILTGTTEFPAASAEAYSLVINAVTRAVTRRAHRPHVRCGCRSLSETEIALGPSAVAARAWTS
ncbi:hypothetical protein [Cryobacterium roopkundense]|uniref:TOMM leader peptide-binding protein n=1 Tax=Cryobacterium roopkundense TaxID=1001240 RepID=A0A7W9E3Q0_9MICO|nr:hypothetical protein [Cryobacterium roopkundense]MBB5641857.1 hypothetical protein [Cryobacterium roopkundense]